MLVTSADTAAATEGLEVARQIDVNELSEQASRGGLARLSANQRILVAVILIAAVFPALPPEARKVILEDAGLSRLSRLSRLSWSSLSARARLRLAHKFIEGSVHRVVVHRSPLNEGRLG